MTSSEPGGWTPAQHPSQKCKAHFDPVERYKANPSRAACWPSVLSRFGNPAEGQAPGQHEREVQLACEGAYAVCPREQVFEFAEHAGGAGCKGLTECTAVKRG